MFKKIFGLFFLSYTLLAPAMAVQELSPGTVVNPLNQVGQFTVTIPQASSSGVPALAQASADIFKTKGTPVIVSTVAGNAPWWALTTGTGYLLISQFDPSIPFSTALAGGAGYALGQEIGAATSTLPKASQLALLAAFLGTAYMSSNALLSDAFMAATQALGLQTALALSSQFISSKPTTPQTSTQKTGILNNIKVALNSGLGDALHVHAVVAFMNVLGSMNSASLIHILLYEQAYRLALAGSQAAQQLFSSNKIIDENKSVPKSSAKKEHPIVTIM